MFQKKWISATNVIKKKWLEMFSCWYFCDFNCIHQIDILMLLIFKEMSHRTDSEKKIELFSHTDETNCFCMMREDCSGSLWVTWKILCFRPQWGHQDQLWHYKIGYQTKESVRCTVVWITFGLDYFQQTPLYLGIVKGPAINYCLKNVFQKRFFVSSFHVMN